VNSIIAMRRVGHERDLWAAGDTWGKETKYVLNLLGIESPEALKKQLDDEERAAAIAKAEEEERAAQEAIRVEEAAKVKEINDALASGRLIVCLNGRCC
jgi:hypothetical protein